MDRESRQLLARLVRSARVAALGTLRDGAPLVSLVPYAASPDFSYFCIHVSRLAQHTQGLARDPRVGLMIAEADAAGRNPQLLARLSIRGEAEEAATAAAGYEEAKALYLAKFPEAAFNFGLADFKLYRIRAHNARLVGGFGKIFDLTAGDLRSAAQAPS
jgi:putative heme iron utilization protein